MNTSVDFHTAKLLIEKGIIVKSGVKGFSSPYYNHLGELDGDVTELVKAQIHEEDTTPYQTIPAPLIADVVMKLYEKRKIWIGVELTDNTIEFYFQPTIWTSKDRDWHDEDMIDQAKSICKWKEWRYNSPTEAYSEAINYILKNLI